MKLTRLFTDFVRSESAGGVILIICTISSLAITNSAWGASYLDVWAYHVADHTVAHWINDGLMAIFFLLVGLELERELYIGELSNIRNSILPIMAAAGGMIVPAAIHLAINAGTVYQGGAGIPIATDIAFALAILSLTGRWAPPVLKVFLTALAVIDDLGAIMVIAVAYTDTLNFVSLSIAMAIFALLLALNRLRVHNLIPYLIGGTAMWYFMLHSGIHATITGVLLAFAIPFGDGSETSPSFILQHWLHRPVAWVILPLFALANTCIPIGSGWYTTLAHPNSLGIGAGLLLGKPLGIVTASLVSIRTRLAALPPELTTRHIIGAGFLGGVGFTMAIFITLLAFDDPELIQQSKVAVMAASLIAGIIGYLLLRKAPRSATAQE